jgi:hypothetical protein
VFFYLSDNQHIIPQNVVFLTLYLPQGRHFVGGVYAIPLGMEHLVENTFPTETGIP